MNIKDLIINYYNNDINKEKYGKSIDKSGLWQSEKVMFEKYVKKTDKILDLGCGAGRTTINLYRLGYQNIIGLDISDELLQHATNYVEKNNLNIEFILSDATKIEYDPDTFDTVFFSYNGLMCIPKHENREKIFKNVYKILKSNGIFIFTEQDRDGFADFKQFWIEEKSKWDNGTHDKDLYEYGDTIDVDVTGEKTFIHFSSIKEIEELVIKCDFKILECKKRSDIAEENDEVKQFSGETVFWVLQK